MKTLILGLGYPMAQMLVSGFLLFNNIQNHLPDGCKIELTILRMGGLSIIDIQLDIIGGKMVSLEFLRHIHFLVV